MPGESKDAMRSFHAANTASLLMVLLYFITICDHPSGVHHDIGLVPIHNLPGGGGMTSVMYKQSSVNR